MKNHSFNLWPWFFFAAAFESLLSVIALLLIPSEGGISLPRLAVLGILSAIFIAAVLLGYLVLKKQSLFSLEGSFAAIQRGSVILFLAALLSLFLLRYWDPQTLLTYYERLSPLLLLLAILGAQTFFFLLWQQNGLVVQRADSRAPVYRFALAVYVILIGILLFVVFTRLGITPDTGYWGEPGVAIQGWQFALAIFLGVTAMLFVHQGGQMQTLEKYLLPLLIYGTACALWLSVPYEVLQNSFYAPIAPPAQVPFPYSDAGFYDYLSQSLLIGTDYLGGIPPRPLYVVFLAILHLLFGQNYPAMIAVQTCVLALFPVILYYLARKLHSPAAGVIVAFLAIFRELVGLWISSNTRVANSKIFTTDLLTAAGIALLCLVAVWWLERRDLKSNIVAGGVFGLLMLLRTQSLLILPVLFILAWFAFQRKTREWIISVMVFGAVMLLTVLPWLTHNYTVAGEFSFDDPKQVAIIYSQYSLTGNLDLSQFDPQRDSAGNRILSFTLENPGYVAGFFTNHFLNTQIGGVLALPLVKPFPGLREPINLYWMTWDGSLEWYNLIVVLVYLGLFSVGIGAAWRRTNWLGLIPLAASLGYSLSNGIARFSSWRYNLPVDWVFYFYTAMGLIEVIGALALMFGANSQKRIFPPYKQPSVPYRVRPQYLLPILGFMLIGAVPWLAKGWVEPRYLVTEEQLIARLEISGYKADEIRAFLSQDGTILTEGRLLYPRFYRKNDGLTSTNPWPAYKYQDYARIGFVLLNQNLTHMIFPTREVLDFAQGADAIILACAVNDPPQVRVIDFGSTAYQSAPLDQPCE